jgi:hypothetical protein
VSPYKAERPLPQGRLSVAAFLDILGFSDSVRSAYRRGESKDLLKRLTTALKDASRHLKAVKDWKGRDLWTVKMFTDNVVLGIPVLDEDGEMDLGLALSRVGLYQYQLAKHGFFVRGAIAFGDLYMDQNLVFGEALLDAHEAETKLAGNPRIVLHQSAADRVKQHLTYYASIQDNPYNSELLVDVDGQFFVDYLLAPFEIREVGSWYFEDLKSHRNLIQANLKRFAGTTVWSKYSWVAQYHNAVCRRLWFDLKLPADDLQAYQLPADALPPCPRYLDDIYSEPLTQA